jgi:hypothetical protein
MTTQQPNFVQGIGQLIKGIVVLVLVGVFAWACRTSNHSTSSQPSVTPTTLPPGVQQSSIAGVFVPPGARLIGTDRWEIETSYSDAVTQEEALLPVGKPLDGYPWCRKTSLASLSGRPDNTTWLWGGMRDAVVVSVFDTSIGTDFPTIVVRHGSCT